MSLIARVGRLAAPIEHACRRDPRRGGSACGFGTRPWLANAAYAAVIDCSVTSPEPSASDGTLGTSPTPMRLRVLHGLRNADLLQQPHRGAVARRAQRRAQASSTSASECSSSGVHAPCSVVDRIVEVDRSRRRREAGFERGGVDERLERRARLALRLDGAVEMALVEVAAADHRAHVAGRRDPSRSSAACRRRPARRSRRTAVFAAPSRDGERGLALLARAPSAHRRPPLSAACCIGMSIVEKTRRPP